MSHNTPKKILYIITKSNFGGAQKYVYELAVASRDRGDRVLVACGGTGGKHAGLGLLAEKLAAAGITVIPIAHFMRNMSIDDDITAFFEVRRLLREEKPDILHVTSSKAGGIGALAGRLTKVPRIIFTSHGLTIDETWRPRWQRTLIWLGTWLTLSLAHASIMISAETTARARHMPRLTGRIHFIKNGVAPVDFLNRAEALAALELTLPPEHLLIGGIGELHPNKNWHTLISTLPNLPANTHLAIIGSGEAYESLELHIKKCGLTGRAHLLGYIPDAVRYLAAFDVFVLPSIKEGLPYVLLEAGLAHLPVVASDLPGNRDIIRSGTDGFLVTPTPTLLAASIEMLLRDAGMRRAFGAALQERVMTEFSIHHMIEATHALYDSKRSPA